MPKAKSETMDGKKGQRNEKITSGEDLRVLTPRDKGISSSKKHP